MAELDVGPVLSSRQLRCSKEQPVCARCKRLGANCVFPIPYHRSQRQASRRQPRIRSHSDAKALSDEGYASPSDRSRPHGSPRGSAAGISIPRDLQLMLIEVLYDCFFHAHLIFHRADMMKAIANGIMPEHSLQAMFALSSM